MISYESETLPPAQCIEDCIVGPSTEERLKGNSCWGPYGYEQPAKRRRTNKENGEDDEHPKSNASTFSNAIQAFLSSGCCTIKNVLPSEFVMKSKLKITSDLEYLSSELQERRQEAIESNQEHFISRVARGDFRELTDRDGGRRDIRFQLDRFPFTAPGLVYNPIVYPLIRELLGGGDDVNLLYAGVMWALPQPKPKKVSIDSVSQKWHADGGHLFDHLHLPPHCINVFYPLIDLTPEHGPTEVMTGTHRQGKLKDDSAPKIKLCCDAGSAILFDYRLNHSGSANFTSEARPVLYLCYAKPFFRDAGNTRSDLSIISTTSSKSCSKSSPSWVARILNGEPESMGEGFECAENESDESRHGESSNHCDDMVNGKTGDSALPIPTKNGANNGSGERWILFKMNVELPGSEGNPKVITIYHGDVAVEVSLQFCKKNGLGEEFIPILAQSIDAQISASLKQNS